MAHWEIDGHSSMFDKSPSPEQTPQLIKLCAESAELAPTSNTVNICFAGATSNFLRIEKSKVCMVTASIAPRIEFSNLQYFACANGGGDLSI